jgi:hypothetical protein
VSSPCIRYQCILPEAMTISSRRMHVKGKNADDAPSCGGSVNICTTEMCKDKAPISIMVKRRMAPSKGTKRGKQVRRIDGKLTCREIDTLPLSQNEFSTAAQLRLGVSDHNHQGNLRCRQCDKVQNPCDQGLSYRDHSTKPTERADKDDSKQASPR